MNFLDSCRKFIALDSTPNHGTVDITNFAADLCDKIGISVETQVERVSGIESQNVIGKLDGESDDQPLILQTHLDTPDPGMFAMWSKTESNPFNASIYGDKLYGLGAADCKLDFLCKLQAMEKFKGKKLKRSIYLAGTFGKETGMSGAIKLIRRNKLKNGCVLVGEPTSLHLVNSCSGLANVEVNVPFTEEEKAYRKQHDLMERSSSQSKVFYGKAAHTSHPLLGENAIINLFEYLSQLPEGIAIMDIDGGVSFNTIPDSAFLEFDIMGGFRETIVEKFNSILSSLKEVEKEFDEFPSRGFEPPIPTMNIGKARTFEDYIQLVGCCRLPPSVTQSIYEDWMKKIGATCQSVGATFRITEYKHPFETDESSELISSLQHTAERNGLSKELLKSSVCTEANVFNRLGMSCIVFGPGQGVGNSYGPNEFISIDELKQATRFYEAFIERYCL